MSSRVDDEKLLEKYKNIWTKIEDLQNTESDDFRVYDANCIKAKIRTYGHNVYANVLGLNLPENGVERESFTVISIDRGYSRKKKYLVQI